MRQEQRLKLTPQIYQAIKLMSLPILDLKLKIQEELEKNPALEIVEDNSTVSLDDVTKRDTEDYNSFEEGSDPGYSKREAEEASKLKRQFIEGALARPESLQDHLIWQLKLQPINSSWYEIGELLIHNLDQNGFHRERPESLVKEENKGLLEPVIKLIQKFDPSGVCTKDYKESLLVQIENHAEPYPPSRQIVEKFLDLLEKSKYREIAGKMKISEQEVREAVDFIKTLDPMPGRNYVTESPRYVIPDVIVKFQSGDFVIILNDEQIPVLGINSFFMDIVKDKNNKKDLKQFAKSNLKDAEWFIHSIGQRNTTLLKCCRTIIEFQRDFFRSGPKYLKPLILKDIATEIGVHEATVSRITTAKYIQTEWGIFELKYFFSNSISGTGSAGSTFSKQGVKEILKEIVEQEVGTQLTDNKITEMLSERGIKIARRTVSKYRKELDIPSSFQR